MIAGADPEEYGYPMKKSRFTYIKSMIQEGKWGIGPDDEWMWKDLQRHLLPANSLQKNIEKQFFDWFQQVNVEEFRRNSTSNKSMSEQAVPDL